MSPLDGAGAIVGWEELLPTPVWVSVMLLLAPDARLALFGTCRTLRKLRAESGWATVDLRPGAQGCLISYAPPGHVLEQSSWWLWRAICAAAVTAAGEQLEVLDASQNKFISVLFVAKALCWQHLPLLEDRGYDSEDADDADVARVWPRIFQYPSADELMRRPLTTVRIHKLDFGDVELFLQSAPPAFSELAADVLVVGCVSDACEALGGLRFPALRFKQLCFELPDRSLDVGYVGPLRLCFGRDDAALLKAALEAGVLPGVASLDFSNTGMTHSNMLNELATAALDSGCVVITLEE